MDICVSIELSKDVRDSLNTVTTELKKYLSGQFIEKDNHRIILKYIKNVNDKKVHQIRAALGEVCNKSTPFAVVCNDFEYLDARNKSQLVYTLRGNASKLESIQQYIENEMFKKGIERSSHIDFPYIALSYVIPIKPFPSISTPQDMIKIGQIHLLEIHTRFGKRTVKELDTYPLIGGHLEVQDISGDVAFCKNEYGVPASINLSQMPNHLAEGDVVKMVGSIYVQDLDKTRVRMAHSRLKKSDF